jgi:hypothetical protein
MRRGLALVVTVLALAGLALRLAGIGSGTRTTTITAPNPSAYTPPTTTTSSVAEPTATAPPPATTPSPPAPSYPIVHFTITLRTTTPAGTWPFTAQLVSITESPNGFPASDIIPPQDTFLMVQVAITSQITGRTTVMPEPVIGCHGPGDHAWAESPREGYDQGSETGPDPQGGNVAMGDGQPHLWDTEWQVPSGTSTKGVKCVLESETSYPLASGRVIGSAKLN